LKKTGKELRDVARNIKLLVVDVDGVMTDGSIILDNAGNEYKLFHVRDGHGIRMLVRAGLKVAIITGRQSKVVEIRARELGITDVYQRCHEKTAALDRIMGKYGFGYAEVAYMGDDIVDVPVLKKAGIPIAVSDASDEAREAASMITRNRGGRGAVREVCDFLLKAKGLWKSATKEYFET
jgi:3-deoxy-D-manno-octulosonate 8-phosphate phosphatase (KDO 8-P phosphatase)